MSALFLAWPLLAALAAAESAPAPEPAAAPETTPASAPAPPESWSAPAPPEAHVPDWGPRNAISASFLALRAAALSLQYERMLLAPRWTALVVLGTRFGRERDYGWLSVNGALEGRFYFLARRRVAARLSFFRGARKHDGGMLGPFAGARVDLAWGRLRDRVDGEIAGANVTLSPLLVAGFRVAWLGLVETSVVGALGTRIEIDPSGRLAPYAQGVVQVGLTAGILF